MSPNIVNGTLKSEVALAVEITAKTIKKITTMIIVMIIFDDFIIIV